MGRTGNSQPEIDRQEHLEADSFGIGAKAVALTGYNQTNGELEFVPSDFFQDQAVRVETSGLITYVGLADPGSGTDDPVWKIRKIDETSGTVITWADGNTKFDNVWDNHASLTYL